MENRPVIGIMGYQTQPNAGVGLRQTYIDAVLHSGGLPVILPLITDEQAARQLLARIDGMILSGGGDVDPALFGEEKIPQCGEPDPLRDASELLFTRLAREVQMPIFGICRGVQALNIAYGGTLIQDIESQRGIARAVHRQEEPYCALAHEVALTQGGLLHRITGMTRMATNTIHHQAINTLGGSLVVEATAPDGIIEAVSDRMNDAVFGVQFHPEFFFDESKGAQKLFAYFVERAQAYAEHRRIGEI